MNSKLLFSITLTAALTTMAQPPANTMSSKGPISVKEMLESGPTQLKFHSLMMIKQGEVQEQVDDSYLAGLKITANHLDPVLRSITAQILGQKFIEDQKAPNQEAIELITALSSDESSDVRFNAIYYGLSSIINKTPELAEQLIDIAAGERNPALQDRIIISLTNYQPQVEEILNEKLKGDDAIAYYEIYEEFTGKEPLNADKFLNMPSSRPHLIVIKPGKKNAEAAMERLKAELKQAGLENPSVEISGQGDNYVLMLTTYITRDYKAAKAALSDSGEFSISQDMWLTPELEIQIEALRKAKN